MILFELPYIRNKNTVGPNASGLVLLTVRVQSEISDFLVHGPKGI